MKKNKSDIKTWSEIKNEQFGEKGTPRRDELDREFETFNPSCS